MKMYCKIKRPDNAKYQIEKGQLVVIQEKLDGVIQQYITIMEK